MSKKPIRREWNSLNQRHPGKAVYGRRSSSGFFCPSCVCLNFVQTLHETAEPLSFSHSNEKMLMPTSLFYAPTSNKPINKRPNRWLAAVRSPAFKLYRAAHAAGSNGKGLLQVPYPSNPPATMNFRAWRPFFVKVRWPIRPFFFTLCDTSGNQKKLQSECIRMRIGNKYHATLWPTYFVLFLSADGVLLVGQTWLFTELFIPRPTTSIHFGKRA